jgi:hypothetical protein
LNVSLWSALERCRFINPESPVDDLIEINLGEKCRCRAVRRGQNVDQKRRRFVTLAAKLDRAALVWWSPHIRASAKTTNIATTPAETRIESMGIATSR